MKDRCPGSGTVVTTEPGLHVAECPDCHRIITTHESRRFGFRPALRPHVAHPAPSVFNRGERGGEA